METLEAHNATRPLELPNGNKLRPNIMGATAKVLRRAPDGYLDQKFVVGENGLFRFSGSPIKADDLTSQIEFRTDRGYVKRGEDLQQLRLSFMDLLATPIGHYLASEAGVFYAPFLFEHQPFSRIISAGNPEPGSPHFELDRFSIRCGDSVSNPPVNVSSLARSSQPNVILAVASNGMYRLEVFDYSSTPSNEDRNPIFQWTRLKELVALNINSAHFLGRTGYNDVWLMTSSSKIYRVEANPRSRRSPISISDVTTEFISVIPGKSRPTGTPARSFYDEYSQSITVIFDDSIYSFRFDPKQRGLPVNDSTITQAALIMHRSETNLGSLFSGYYGRGDKVGYAKDGIFVATPQFIKVLRSGGTTQLFDTPFLKEGYQDVFPTMLGVVSTSANPNDPPESLILGLSTGKVLEYSISAFFAGSGKVKLNAHLSEAVPSTKGRFVPGTIVHLPGAEYVLRDNPPCFTKAAKSAQDAAGAVTAALEAYETQTLIPIIIYVSYFVFGWMLPRKSREQAEFHKFATGYEGQAACCVVLSQPVRGTETDLRNMLDDHHETHGVEVLTYDMGDSNPIKDFDKITYDGKPENCSNKTGGCDSHVKWARWISEGTSDITIVTVNVKGVPFSYVQYWFKNWSHDRTRGAQVNLILTD